MPGGGWRLGAALLAVVAAAGCDKAQLLAPTESTISVSASTRVLPLGGTTEVTAVVIEQAGTPVHNGTTVRFTTNLGRLEPVEAQTRNGVATTIFHAGDASGIAEIRAISGAALGGTNGSATNVVEISVGAAATSNIVLRANPATVGPFGGTVELIATVFSERGQSLPGVPVTFEADNGSLSTTVATTDASGEARTTLTTNVATTVTARAGGEESNQITVGVRDAPGVTLTCAVEPAPGGTAASCSSSRLGQIVTFTVAPGAGSARIRSATLDFGDGTQIDLGSLSGSTTVSHRYTEPGVYTARATVTDLNGETATAVQTVRVETVSTVTLSLSNTSGRTVVASASVTEGSSSVLRYQWNFGAATDVTPATISTTGNTASATYTTAGLKTVSVTVEFVDGRTATDSAQIAVP